MAVYFSALPYAEAIARSSRQAISLAKPIYLLTDKPGFLSFSAA